MSESRSLEIECSSCGATLSVEAHLKTTRCPYCDSPKVVERPPSPDRPQPVFVVPFVVPERDAFERVRKWIGRSRFFAPSAFKRAGVKKTRGVYLPARLYGAVAESEYTAEIGEEYQETRTVKTKNGWRTETVQRIEWRSLSGRRDAYVRDVIVSASKGLPNEELEQVEPFELGALHRYQPALVSGWAAEEASLSAEECLTSARNESHLRIGRELKAFMPGFTQRRIRHRTRFVDEVNDLVLLPLWVFAARWDESKPPVRLLVNGQTGEVWGKVPISWAKVALAVALGLAAVGGIVAAIALGAS